jgi:hypothetical protein
MSGAAGCPYGFAVLSRRGFFADGMRYFGATSVAGIAAAIAGLSLWSRDAGGAAETRRSKLEGRKRKAPMTEVPREHLVILEPGVADQARSQVESVAVVTQALKPRLLLIRADAKAKERVSQIAGVVGVYDDLPSQTSSDMSPEEHLFINAWAARRQPKTRPGEGLPWDTPGFLPPDAPTGRPK